MSGAKERPQSTDVQTDQKKYSEGWDRIFGPKDEETPNRRRSVVSDQPKNNRRSATPKKT